MAKNIISIQVSAFLLLFLAVQARAQVKISGKVTAGNHSAVPFASVKIQGTADGAITDSTGQFNFTTSKDGNQILTVSSIGYSPYNQSISIKGDLYLNIVLKMKQQRLQGVVINSGDFEASDKATGASLTPMDVFTVAGNNADLALGLRSLPGAQQVGEQSGLFVRGGTGEETKQFIDGMLMPFPNYNEVPGLLQPARINPILFKGILFSTGGYSALYGQAMSSALILNSIDFPDQSSFSINVFPPHGGLGFQKIANNKASSYGINLNYSNQSFLYKDLIHQHINYTHGPEYIEGDANFRKKIGKTGMLKLYVNWSKSHVGLWHRDIDSLALRSDYELKSQNIYANLTYRQFLNEKWKISSGLAYDFNQEERRLQLRDQDNDIVKLPDDPYREKNDQRKIHADFAQGRVVLTRFFSRNQSLDFGVEHFYTQDHLIGLDSSSILKDHLTAVFTEGNVQFGNHFAARIGGRFEYSSLLGQSSVSPRINLAYQFDKQMQANFTYGIFYQKPENRWLYYDQNLKATYATHYIFTFTHKASNRFFRASAYYKKYHDLIKTTPEMSNNGEGYAKGFELFWRDKKSVKNLDYWISYTYLDSKRNYLNFPYTLRPEFTAPHTATMAVREFIPAISTYLNISYAFAAGRPYYNIVGGKDNAPSDITASGTTKVYSIANLHLAYIFHMFKNWKKPTFSGVALGINNLFGTKQVFGYNYSYNGKNREPITLPASRYYYLGFWISLGVDQTENILNNM